MQIVPQYIDVEDKIVGPLTWKHLGWIFGGLGIIFIAYAVLDNVTFFIVAIPIGLLTVMMAFYRPQGIPFFQFIGYGLAYLFQSKTYTWQREVQKKQSQKKKKNIQVKTMSKDKEITTDDIVALAQTLDSGGKERSDKIRQLIKERAVKDIK